MTPANDLLQIINSLSGELHAKYKVNTIGLFGSFARGEQKKESDVDLLVEFGDNADLFDYLGLSLFLEEKLGRKVDIVSKKTVRSELSESILKEVKYR
jgi:predicted nucleotidyltransferase